MPESIKTKRLRDSYRFPGFVIAHFAGGRLLIECIDYEGLPSAGAAN
jgi:hypothetical protein